LKKRKCSLYIRISIIQKKKELGVIGIGSMSDTYNPKELEFEQTRGALKLISSY